MAQQVLVNLAVADTQRSKRFFTALGFSFDEQFTNESVATTTANPRCRSRLR